MYQTIKATKNVSLSVLSFCYNCTTHKTIHFFAQTFTETSATFRVTATAILNSFKSSKGRRVCEEPRAQRNSVHIDGFLTDWLESSSLQKTLTGRAILPVSEILNLTCFTNGSGFLYLLKNLKKTTWSKEGVNKGLKFIDGLSSNAAPSVGPTLQERWMTGELELLVRLVDRQAGSASDWSVRGGFAGRRGRGRVCWTKNTVSVALCWRNEGRSI